MKKQHVSSLATIYNWHFAKRLTMMIAIVLIMELVLFSVFVRQEKKRNFDMVEMMHQSEISLIQQAFEAELMKVKNDLFILKDSNDVAAFLRAPNSEENHLEMTRIFKNFQSNNTAYNRLALYDQQGALITQAVRNERELITQLPQELDSPQNHVFNPESPSIFITEPNNKSSLIFTLPLHTADHIPGGYLELEYQLSALYDRILVHTQNHPQNFYGLYTQAHILFKSQDQPWTIATDEIREQFSEGHHPIHSAFVHVAGFPVQDLVNQHYKSHFTSTDTLYLTIQTKKPPFLYLDNPNVQSLILIESLVLLAWILVAVHLARSASIRENERNQHRLMSDVLESLNESLVIADENHKIVYTNPAFCTMMGYSQNELINSQMSRFHSNHHEPAFYRNLSDSLQENGIWEGKLWDQTRDGLEILKSVKITKIVHPDQSIRYFGVYNDVDPSKDTALGNYRSRYYDLLTDLPNESLLPRLLTESIESHEKINRKLGIAIFQILHLCDSEDMYASRNQLIQKAAMRLKDNLDQNRGILARTGLTEFTIVYPDIANQDDFFAALAKTKNHLDEPYSISPDTECNISYAIGLSMYPMDGTTAFQLIEEARIHLSQKNRYRFNDQFRSEAFQRYFAIESALHAAIQKDELSIVYQPQVDPNTSKCLALEALLRWKHPILGNIPPSEFIPIAEANGTIVSIGEWIVMQVIAFQQRVLAEHVDPIPISINISMVQLEDPYFYEQLRLMLEVYNLPKHSIELELTESLLMSDLALSQSRLELIKDLGVSISIDDFGTGYSSLAYLKELAVDKIKIDRLFIKDYPNDDGSVLNAITQLLNGLSYKIVMEGVETQEQNAYVKELGIELIQGYYYSKPLSSAKTLEYLLHNSI